METIRFRPEPQKGKHAKVIAQDFMRLDALEIVSPLYRELVELTRRPASMPAGIKGGVLRRQLPARMASAIFSPIMIVGALVLPVVSAGISDASAMRNPAHAVYAAVLIGHSHLVVPIRQVATGGKRFRHF
ncbi:hypothetical protein [Rhizobium oryzihabitans]|uniref:hypothetical protein n=1 Tax=Rhizobium oryzihabitans TaxID=2267833 RepID=UPI003CCD049B